MPSNYDTALNSAQLARPLTSDVHNLKHAHVPKADILNTCCKLVSVDQQRSRTLCDTYCS